MKGKVFFDTNILVYSVDSNDPAKREACRELLRNADRSGTGVLSTQVLQEFYVTATGKLGIDSVDAKGLMRGLQRYEVVTITPEMIEGAVDCSILSQLSFWDALIVVAAESARCATLWTEDLHDGQVIRGVRVVNPLAPDFRPLT